MLLKKAERADTCARLTEQRLRDCPTDWYIDRQTEQTDRNVVNNNNSCHNHSGAKPLSNDKKTKTKTKTKIKPKTTTTTTKTETKTKTKRQSKLGNLVHDRLPF